MAMTSQAAETGTRQRFLQRLAKDEAGNALVIMAAAMVPMIGMIGSGVDMSRAYMAKARLQQACDAGVLAGRRAQADDAFNTAAAAEAQRYFSFNYPDDEYGATSVNFVVEAGENNIVEGRATLDLPTTVIGFFGINNFNLSVTCDASLEATNTDIMFVLDVTGSMADCPDGSTCNGGPGSKIVALREAVKDFYDVLESARGEEVQVRYGFLPYSQAVNVGKLLPASMVWTDDYQYQSRTYNGTTNIGPGNSGYSNFDTQGECEARSGTWNGSTRVCTYPTYRHQQVTIDDDIIEDYVAGEEVEYPGQDQFPTVLRQTTTWAGCIEERRTVAADSFSPVPADAEDLDIDTPPVANDLATTWRPMFPEVAYGRNGFSAGNFLDTSRGSNSFITPRCPVEAKRLAVLTAADVATYVDGLQPGGNTYHDIGMIWGTRLLSPTGIFRNDTLTSQNGLPVARHIIFMTDGDMVPSFTVYGTYGYERGDRRVNGSSTDSGQLTNRHNARFLAMCAAAKARNIRVWTIGFGTALTTQLQTCADSGRAFQANDADELNEQFRIIATEIAQLRLTE